MSKPTNLPPGDEEIRILEAIRSRVLWLATYSIHHANSIRENPDGTKVGGHQASSASMVSMMTALYFRALKAGDRVSVKPHASPVYHAIQTLLGKLAPEKLKQLRQFGGLQAYPSRTKDPDDVDISTGSVGLGAVATVFGALTQQFVHDHFGGGIRGRYISLVGDAELDEGNVWEAIGEEALEKLRGVVWVVDLNRQSLDRVVPAGKAQRLEQMFQVNGWHLIELKYGSRLEAAFARPNGAKLRDRIDRMSNAEYQGLLRLDGESIRAALPSSAGLAHDEDLVGVLRPYPASEIKELIADLGGHDLRSIIRAFEEADRITDKPVVIVAYTIKGWGLPFAGDPLNHSLLLNDEQLKTLQAELGVPEGGETAGFPEESAEGRYIREYRRAFEAAAASADRGPGDVDSITIPESLGEAYRGSLSTQQVFGRILTSLSRMPEIAARMVTTSPDVAISTNLGGWINKMGVYSHTEAPGDPHAGKIRRLLNWQQSSKGHHIELGISENTLFLLLAMLGLSKEFTGQTLIPIGTLYDPFVCRGLDALIYATYSESQFIFAGTPAGISLSPEGGAHQSTITPSIGIELPNLVYYEPTFSQELEWILLAAMKSVVNRGKKGFYLRLSTKSISQDLFPGERLSTDAEALARLRKDVIRGGYRLVDRRHEKLYQPGRNVIHLFVTGVMVPECVAASTQLLAKGVFANVIQVTSPGLLYRDHRETTRSRTKTPSLLEELVPPAERGAPVITVMDGHSHALSFIGGALGSRMINLGVDEFGQSGTRGDLYRHYEIDETAIVQAVERALEAP